MKKRLCKWHGYEKVGIWENVPWQVSLYEGFATIRRGYVRWRNNEGSLAEVRYRVEGRVYELFKVFYECQVAERDNYVDEVYQTICEEGF